MARRIDFATSPYPCLVCDREVGDGERVEIVGMNERGMFGLVHIKADGSISCGSYGMVINTFDGLVRGLQAIPRPELERIFAELLPVRPR